jgi:hypothetical protein
MKMIKRKIFLLLPFDNSDASFENQYWDVIDRIKIKRIKPNQKSMKKGRKKIGGKK